MSRVLLVDDESRFSQATGEALRSEGHRVTVANCLAAAKEALRRDVPEFVLLDLMLPDGNGLELLDQLDEDWAGGLVIITGHESFRNYIRELDGPNVTYLTKPVDALQIVRLVEGERRQRESEESDAALHFGLLLGESEPMLRVYDEISKFAPTEATVLIEGESGTGKELVAGALHQLSRRSGPFVPANCGGLTHELVASELFGHEKGSFTGATRRHAGVFERAAGGTLFLDEITEMPLDMQTFLLRTLESGEIVRVGGEHETAVDVRLLAATNRPAVEARDEGKLRADLYYRLRECMISLPPLRQRGDDIDLLVTHSVAELNRRYGEDKRPSEAFLDQCRRYAWPGNVRELKHVVHRAYLLADSDDGEIPADRRFEEMQGFEQTSGGIEPGRSIRDVERDLIFKTLEHCGGDKQAAADSLGVCLKTLYNRLNEYGADDETE
jgi:DNA-binding NtrC family response regulator